MNQYNPCLEIEFKKLEADGSESDMDVELFGPTVVNDPNNMNDLNHHGGNRPLRVQCSVNKALGSGQQTAAITIHNSPFIERLRVDYNRVMDTMRKQVWRVRIWAWHSDSLAAPTRPTYISPLFIGDVVDDFSMSNGGLNDNSIQINAQGHGWLTTVLASENAMGEVEPGGVQRMWPEGTSCKQIVTDIFQEYFIDVMQYGGIAGTTGLKYTITDPDDILLNATSVGSFTVDRNPIAVIDDICRQHDFVWGFNNLKPYILPRNRGFSLLDVPLEKSVPSLGIIKNESGLLSLVDMGKYEFNFRHYWDNGLLIGLHYQVGEQPQINSQIKNGPAGRINSLSISLDNYGEHTCSVNCQGMIPKPGQLAGGNRYALPPSRFDTSGRSTT